MVTTALILVFGTLFYLRALAFCKWIIDVRLQICQHPNNLKRFKFFWQLLSLKKYLNVFDHKHDWRTITRMTIMKQIKTTSHECTFPWLNIVKIAIGLLSHASDIKYLLRLYIYSAYTIRYLFSKIHAVFWTSCMSRFTA